jgi:hypothetical protein
MNRAASTTSRGPLFSPVRRERSRSNHDSRGTAGAQEPRRMNCAASTTSRGPLFSPARRVCAAGRITIPAARPARRSRAA